MSDVPFTVSFGDKHGEARWSRYRLSILHAGKRVIAGDDDSVIAKHDGMPFLDRVLVAAVFYKREIFSDGLCSYGYHGTNGSEQDCIRPIILTTASGSFDV